MGDSLASNIKVTGQPNLKSINPTAGSSNGGTKIKIIGNGFSNLTVVKMDTSICEIVELTVNELSCITSAHSIGSVAVEVSTNGQVYTNNGINFNYDSSLTPIISTISPTSENSVNSVLTITGTGFGINSSKILFY